MPPRKRGSLVPIINNCPLKHNCSHIKILEAGPWNRDIIGGRADSDGISIQINEENEKEQVEGGGLGSGVGTEISENNYVSGTG